MAVGIVPNFEQKSTTKRQKSTFFGHPEGQRRFSPQIINNQLERHSREACPCAAMGP
jgi:hypothetical protein